MKNERKAEFEMGESRWFELKEMYLGSQGGTGLRELGASEQQMKKAEPSESDRQNGRGHTVRRASKQTASVGEFLQIHVPNMRTYVFSCYKLPNFDLRT